MQIKWKRLHPLAQIPKIQSKGAACVDLVATRMYIDEKDPNVIVYGLGFASAIPEGWKVVIEPRSNFTGKPWIMQNTPAQIDSDYRGEWLIKFRCILTNIKANTEIKRYNNGEIYEVEVTPYFESLNQPYNIGDRIAQCSIEKVNPIEFIEVNELDSTERGSGGFGSTNKPEHQGAISKAEQDKASQNLMVFGTHNPNENY